MARTQAEQEFFDRLKQMSPFEIAKRGGITPEDVERVERENAAAGVPGASAERADVYGRYSDPFEAANQGNGTFDNTVADVWNDTLGDVWDTVAGVNDYRATPYSGALPAAAGYKTELDDFAAQQRAAAPYQSERIAGAGDAIRDAGASAANDIRTMGMGLVGAGNRYADDLYASGDRAYSDAYGYGEALKDIGDYSANSAARYSSGLEGRAAGLEGAGDYYGGALETLSGDIMSDPSYAEIAGRAAMDRAAQEATARAASARGGNANLQIREANAMTAANNRGLTNDLMAARAREMADRRALQGQTLDRAGQTVLQGRNAGAGVYGQASDVMTQGLTQQGNLYAQGAGVVGAGNTQAGNMYNAGAGVGMQGREGAVNAMGVAGQTAIAGETGRADAYGKASDVYSGMLADAAGTQGEAAKIGMTGESITAGSWDNANAANAGITGDNAKNQSDTTKEIFSTLGKAYGYSKGSK